MSVDLQVVWFLDRRVVRLGVVRGGERGKGPALVDDDGETHRWKEGKALHALSTRLPDPGQAPAVRDRLRRLFAELAGPARAAEGPDQVGALLDRGLEDGKRYTLAEVAQAVTGRADDRGVAGLVAALGPGVEGWIGHGLRLEAGGVVRLEAEARAKIRAQREAEARRKAEEEALAAFFEEGQDLRDPPAAVRPAFDLVVEFALAGDLARDAQTGRRLAKRLGHDGPETLLAALERGGALPPHVNETPRRHGLALEPTAAALAEARRLAELGAARGATGELDLRGRPTLAIDDAGTTEVDDALSLWEEGGETWLAIHIARAGDVLPLGGPLDEDARRRATTVYFADGSIPMLPPVLVQGLSLDAGRDRPALSLVARLGPDGLPIAPRFTTSVIRVERHLVYEAWTPDAATPDGALLARLLPIVDALREARRARGATILGMPALRLKAVEGVPVARVIRNDSAAQMAVSELMVLYNTELGRTLAAGGAAALYRTQTRPVKRPAREPDDPLFASLARRGLPPTIVEVRPAPHRMLGADAYVQGTSPIRRYGDLIAQRQLLALLSGQPPPYDVKSLGDLQGELEAAEKRAGRAMDERERYWLTLWLAAHPGPHAVHVSRSDDRGLQAYLPALDRDLPIQRHPTRTLVVGDPVDVRVTAAQPRLRTATLEPVVAPVSDSP